MRPIDHIVIHCSATPASMDIGRHEINQWHMERGWRGIGYHYVIRRDGHIEIGRSEAQVGAHVSGHNAKSIGVCMVGGVERHNGVNVAQDNFTPAQWASLKQLVQQLNQRYPLAKIVGHRDLYRGKECPSFSVRDWLTREKILTNGIAWNSGVDATPPPPVMLTPQVIGTATAGATGLGAVGNTLTESAQTAQPVAQAFPWMQLILMLLIVTGTGLVIYHQFQTRKRTGV
jgi:N-acetylmuramoyl-L-alanine amidase